MPINSKDEAKNIFFNYNCNKYGIYREIGSEFEEYIKKYITEEELEKWTEQFFFQKFDELKLSGNAYAFYVMSEIMNKTDTSFQIMEDSLEFIKYEKKRDRIIVSNAILGESSLENHSGLLFNSYEANKINLANHLVKYVYELISINDDDERIEGILKKLRERFFAICKIFHMDMLF